MLDIKRKMLITKDTIDFLFMLDIKIKMLLEKDTIDFPLIYVGHKNENKYETMPFIFIHVGHKNKNTVKKRDNAIFVDLCWT